ncbi:hypothetical protein BC938DRAFT_481798, partial [Jimgerdemannia flammicorona]
MPPNLPLPTDVSIHFFLFVNPKSGDHQGDQILQLGLDTIQFKALRNVQVHVHNLLDEADREEGYENVRSVLESKEQFQITDQKAYICVAG